MKKLWEVFFYVGCIGEFAWDNESIDDSIRYVTEYMEISNIGYETQKERDSATEKIVSVLQEKYQDNHIPYHYLSSLIYDYEYNFTEIEFENSSFYRCFDNDTNGVVHKIMDHIYLSINYKSKIQEVEKNISKYSEKYKELDSSYQSLKDSYSKLQGQYNRVTFDFIAILGIFTGCVFAVFGGFEGIKAVLEINNISKMVIVASIVLFVIIMVLFSFIQFIGVLTERNVVSCGCDLENTRKHQCHYYERYRILTISLSISLCLFFIGLIMTPLSVPRYAGFWTFILNNWVNVIGFLGLVCLLSWYGCILRKNTKSMKRGES